MSSLRTDWQKRLEAARLDPSWQGRAEVRLLCFVLGRSGADTARAPLSPFPLVEGDAPYGRARLLLSSLQQRSRLHHIAHICHATRHVPVGLLEEWRTMQDDALSASAHRAILRRQRDNARRHP